MRTQQAGERLPVVEDFYTVQGEGRHTGRAAYFIRLAGCGARCPWCDAAYTWQASQYPPVPIGEVLERLAATPAEAAVITGGEPLLHPLGPLTEVLHARGIEVLLETAGTHPFSGRFDWVCLSPKPQAPPLDEAFARADELKVVIASEADFAWAEQNAARIRPVCQRYLQPEWSAADRMLPQIVDYVKAHPAWRISLQTHKYLNIP